MPTAFLLDYRNRVCLPQVKRLGVDMSLNASGVRDTARSLRISTDPVLSELKKKEPALKSVNPAQPLDDAHLRIVCPEMQPPLAAGAYAFLEPYHAPTPLKTPSFSPLNR